MKYCQKTTLNKENRNKNNEGERGRERESERGREREREYTRGRYPIAVSRRRSRTYQREDVGSDSPVKRLMDDMIYI